MKSPTATVSGCPGTGTFTAFWNWPLPRPVRIERVEFGPFDPVITIPWRRLAPHSGELEELVERLEGAEAVDARGMAKLRLLLRDGESPLNTQSGAETLAEALQEALDALAPLVAGSNARDL